MGYPSGGRFLCVVVGPSWRQCRKGATRRSCARGLRAADVRHPVIHPKPRALPENVLKKRSEPPVYVAKFDTDIPSLHQLGLTPFFLDDMGSRGPDDITKGRLGAKFGEIRQSPDRCLGSVLNPDLAQHALGVNLYGGFGDIEVSCNQLVRVTRS